MKKIFTMIAIILILLVGTVYADVSFDNIKYPDGEIVGTAESILGYIQWLGYAIAVGMLIYIGIKYTMSAAAEKANLKGLLAKYIIGAVLIAAASTVSGWIFDIVEGLTGGVGVQAESYGSSAQGNNYGGSSSATGNNLGGSGGSIGGNNHGGSGGPLYGNENSGRTGNPNNSGGYGKTYRRQ